MSEEKYFEQALSNFTFEAASGGSIRHLADLGFSARQIMERLDFPTPLDRVQKVIWEHYLDRRILLPEEPGSGRRRERIKYVRDYDRYGKASFRRVVLDEAEEEPVSFQERIYQEQREGPLSVFLRKYCDINGEENSYVSCDFGLRSRREPEQYFRSLEALDEQQKAYILGIPWERRMVYHRLNETMRGILVRLYEKGGYQGTVYFLVSREKIYLQHRADPLQPCP